MFSPSTSSLCDIQYIEMHFMFISILGNTLILVLSAREISILMAVCLVWSWSLYSKSGSVQSKKKNN